MSTWLLYGAYGFTGKLIIEEALARGHRPLLGGRNADKLIALADRYNLDWIDVGLDDADALRGTVAGVDAVLHAAGPFIHTAEPMLQACLAGESHYLDITGEIPVFETTFSYDVHAREQGVALISGVGFDIVPTDCLGAHVAAQVPAVTTLEVAFRGISSASAGTTKTMLELMTTMPQGSLVRRNGRLEPFPLGEGKQQVRFSNGKTYAVIPIPWGDLATAERSTGAVNVTASMAMRLPPGLGLVRPLAARLMGYGPLRGLAKSIVDATVRGPDADMRATGRSYIWARASNAQGDVREGWLETMEGYRLTAVASVRAVEHVLTGNLSGALTPSQAFGADFVLELPDTTRYDALP